MMIVIIIINNNDNNNNNIPNPFDWEITWRVSSTSNEVLNKINMYMGSRIQEIQHKKASEGILRATGTGTERHRPGEH